MAHEGGRAADAHSFPKPLPQKRDRPAAAGIERYADGRGHQNAPGLVAAEQRDHALLRHIALKEGGEQDAEQKIRPRRPDVAAHIQQIADQKIGVRVVTGAFLKTGEIKKAPVPIEHADQQACGAAAEKAGDDPHRKHFRPQRGTVDDELGIQKNRSHHEGRQPVMAHPLSGKGRGNGNGAIHAQR